MDFDDICGDVKNEYDYTDSGFSNYFAEAIFSFQNPDAREIWETQQSKDETIDTVEQFVDSNEVHDRRAYLVKSGCDGSNCSLIQTDLNDFSSNPRLKHVSQQEVEYSGIKEYSLNKFSSTELADYDMECIPKKSHDEDEARVMQNSENNEEESDLLSDEETLPPSSEPKKLYDLLCSWNQEKLFDHFLAENIFVDVLKVIKNHHIEQLLQNFDMGTQIMFEHKLDCWRRSIGKPMASEKHYTSKSRRNVSSPLQCEVSLNSPSHSRYKPYSRPTTPDASNSIHLSHILNETHKGKMLVEFYKMFGKFQAEQRNWLIATVAQYFNKKSIPMSLPLSYRLEREILKRFPNEKLEFYRTSKRGKIYNKCANIKRSFNCTISKHINSNTEETPPKHLKESPENTLASISVHSEASSDSSSSSIPPYSRPKTPDATDAIHISHILNETQRGRMLVEIYRKFGKFQDEHRNLLIATVAQYFEGKMIPMSLPSSYRLEREILEIFPGEKLEFYRTSKRGKLYNKCTNMKKSFNGTIFKHIKSKTEKETPTNSNKRLEKIFVPEIDAEITIRALKFHNLSSAQFDECWKACGQYRLQEIKTLDNTADVLNKWPFYKTPSGYRLVDMDFQMAYGNGDALLSDWNKYYENILSFLMDENHVKDKSVRNVLGRIKEGNLTENGRDAAVFWCIHAYFVPTNRIITKDTDTGKKTTTKFTIKDSQESFLFVGKTIQVVEDHLKQLKNISSAAMVTNMQYNVAGLSCRGHYLCDATRNKERALCFGYAPPERASRKLAPNTTARSSTQALRLTAVHFSSLGLESTTRLRWTLSPQSRTDGALGGEGRGETCDTLTLLKEVEATSQTHQKLTPQQQATVV